MPHKRKVVHLVPSAIRLQSQRLSRIPAALPDRIFGLTEEFEKDHDARKVNLTVGMYRNDKGQMERFHSISQAQRIISHRNGLDDSLAYLPITGSLDYRKNVLDFLFKESATPRGQYYLEENKVSFAQTLSGTGSLALASKFLSSFISSTIWIPNPTWANHLNIFQQNGFDDVRYYNYYENGAIDVSGWLRQLKEAALGDTHPQCILLHACCHNPTGVDPTRQQWQGILDVVNELEMIPIIDMAYQGLESGNLSEDAYLLRMCLEYDWRNGLYVCQSFAKNMGLYGERVGALAVVHPLDSLDSTARVDSQLKRIIRGTYSSPPGYGARVASLVLSNPDLKIQWYRDVQQMCDRLWSVRCMLHDRLGWANLIDRDRQHGMFYYSGLSTRQVRLLKEKHSVYLTQDGRMSLAGINSGNVDYVAEALLHVSRL